MSSQLKISAIILAYNEELLINKIITELKKQYYDGKVEIILADGGSTDSTVTLALLQSVNVVATKKKGKASQMNKAASVATGDLLFFVHADMQLSENTFSSIAQVCREGFDGGGFANIFDSHNAKIKRLGNILNLRIFDKREQSDKGIFYGDNGIFVKRNVFDKLNGFNEIPIMEDYDFSKRMSESFQTIKIREPKIVVSARRHIKAGFTKTRLQWVFIRILFKMGVSPHTLVKLYKDVR
ncbi:glycosyltransferase [Hyunsoonleella ulvae]|uniref:glycosyltransferase n=1 Tax=Hyunsoonleella ulvae TaxID=2799948 RepID=UPI001939EF24|nr:glycosyltransferase [Hyunsoonleella ulvae]